MSLPPSSITLKRKADDEAPEYLYVHEPSNDGGRPLKRATGFVFKKQKNRETDNPSLETPHLFANGLIAAKPHNANNASAVLSSVQYQETNTPALAQAGAAANDTNNPSQTPHNVLGVSDTQASNNKPKSFLQTPNLRRFHMSRSSTPTDLPSSRIDGKSRKRAVPVVFVERKGESDTTKKQKAAEHKALIVTKEVTVDHAEQRRPQKKPGLAARKHVLLGKNALPEASLMAGPMSKPKEMRLPSSVMMPWDVNSDKLAAEMEAYTLQEISKNTAAMEKDDMLRRAGSSYNGGSSQPKFKPRKPALRYHERHPEETLIDSRDATDVEDGTDYVIDTYVRVSVDTLESPGTVKNIGLLVLDSQPDIDEFYLEEWDSDEEEEDEEDDENAEDHYTADYPDEEVDSDDEYGRNAYNYRNHNASDMEEFDTDDVEFSNEEDSKYPWAKPPWMRRPDIRGTALENSDMEI
ncbi:hypothetical protein BGZ60DRAFT_519609 [Tricladium varicosporioides]|nr:hypothetical protein BGZ60DRAFT_519609 [Hymenoscyphus varicosporioides]